MAELGLPGAAIALVVASAPTSTPGARAAGIRYADATRAKTAVALALSPLIAGWSLVLAPLSAAARVQRFASWLFAPQWRALGVEPRRAQ